MAGGKNGGDESGYGAARASEGASRHEESARALETGAGNPRIADKVFGAGWESLTQAYRLMAAIPGDAADDDVLTKQLAVERYATALLVRLRRLKRRGTAGSAELGDDDDDFGNERR